jgi:hypothetical protein
MDRDRQGAIRTPLPGNMATFRYVDSKSGLDLVVYGFANLERAREFAQAAGFRS